MASTIALTGTRRRRGNPNWGQPPQPLRALPTEFEILVKRLGLTKPEYVSSAELLSWLSDGFPNRVRSIPFLTLVSPPLIRDKNRMR
jgi:hypothetical protein